MQSMSAMMQPFSMFRDPFGDPLAITDGTSDQYSQPQRDRDRDRRAHRQRDVVPSRPMDPFASPFGDMFGNMNRMMQSMMGNMNQMMVNVNFFNH